jgi:hypothetical protein
MTVRVIMVGALSDDQKQGLHCGRVDFSHRRYKTGERAKAACEGLAIRTMNR